MFNWLRRTRRPAARTRAFEAAKSSRLLDDWNLSPISIDKDVEGALTTLRARSRDLCQNNDYGKRYLALLTSNVVGPSGVRLQMKIKNTRADGSQVMDTIANRIIEEAWDRWCRTENCTTGRKSSFTELLSLIVTAVPRDGEAVIRIVRNFENPFRFALAPIAIECLDHTLSDANRRIRMGVESDAWGSPVAYHILNSNPYDNSWGRTQTVRTDRIPADQILHVFRAEHMLQTRGFPWTSAAMRRLHIAGKYEESELVAARVGASHMGFFLTSDGSGYGYGDDKDASGNPISEVSPGKFETLARNISDFKQFSPQHPTTAFPDFMKAVLRGAASGLNISYISLANDLADTSYSSGRQGLLEERNYYMQLQNWLIDCFVRPVFEAWLSMAITAGEVRLPFSGLQRFSESATWYPRRWTWIDPKADMEAAKSAVALGINSRTRLAGDQGADLEDVFDELAAEKTAAADLGIGIDPSAAAGPAAGKEMTNAQNN